jgi:hypothetical protein
MLKSETIERLKKLPRSKCFKCGSAKVYRNKLDKCYGCKNKFCYDHLTCGKTFPGMKPSDAYVDYCDACLLRFHPT